MTKSPADQRREFSGTAALVWSLVILAVGIAAWGGRYYFRAAEPVVDVRPSSPIAIDASTQPATPPIDWAAWRAKAWTKIEPRVAAAESAAANVAVEELAGIDEFFDARRGGVRPFAEAVLSLSGKWVFVKAKLPWTDNEAHLRFLNEKFEHHVFRPDELRGTIESVVSTYVNRLRGIENQLLADIRADLSDGSLGVAVPPKFAADEARFRGEFERMLTAVSTEVAGDVSRDLGALVAGEIASAVAVRIGTAVAARLGVSAGILGAGAASGAATLGLGLVVAVVIDVALDKIIRAAGHDPVDKIAEKVGEALTQVRNLIVDGDPEARAAYVKLRAMSTDDPDPTVREVSRDSAERIGAGDQLGLRRELERIRDGRGAMRREALRRLIFDGET